MTVPVRPRAFQAAGPAIKIEAGYGRLYVSGPGYRIAAQLPGSVIDERRQQVQISLTLESLRELRKLCGNTVEQFARYCTPSVIAWAKAAGAMERQVNELHAALATGWRMPLPWHDARANTPAPETAEPAEVHFDENGVRLWKYRPAFDHQKVMATTALTIDGSAFLCEMGTGKTRAAIEAIRRQIEHEKLDVIVVVCPKGVMGTWTRELAMWCPSGVFDVQRLDGAIKDRKQVLANIRSEQRKRLVLLVNYDVLYLLEADLKRLSKSRRVGLVEDEMHRIRNPQAKVTRAAVAIAQVVNWRLGMTGTPILQGAHDIWSQWYTIDLGITFGANFVQFKKEFFDENKYEFSLDAKDGSLREIGTRMRRRGLRYTKAECLDLPPKMYEIEEVDMTPEQSKAYREMEEWLVAVLEGRADNDSRYNDWFELEESEREPGEERVATAANQLAMILRLTQITSGFVPDENGEMHHFLPNPKLEALEGIIDENIPTQQIIVWARYREDVRAIAQRFARYNPVLVQGVGKGYTQAMREAAEVDFQSGKSRLLVANPAAGGVGLNLQRASLAVYYSQGYSLEHRLQSEDRCHRSGSQIHNRVTYVDLIARNTIDGVIQAALASKKSVADVVVDLRRMMGIAA